MNYGTCKGCLLEKAECTERRRIGSQLVGLGVTSIKWKCRLRKPAFLEGQPVTVTLIERGGHEEGDALHDFDAYALRMTGRRVHAYVPKANQYIEQPGDFEFRNNGFVTLSMDHVRPREGAFEPMCEECRHPTCIEDHEDYCRHATPEQRQRHYGEIGSW